MVDNNGEMLNVHINKNREVFINGKNITAITKRSKLNRSLFSSLFADDPWIHAGTDEYHYSLIGLAPAAAVTILKGLGMNISVSTFKTLIGSKGVQYMSDTVLGADVYIKELRDVYYRNIDRPGRPETRYESDFYFVATARNIGTYERYLGNI